MNEITYLGLFTDRKKVDQTEKLWSIIQSLYPSLGAYNITTIIDTITGTPNMNMANLFTHSPITETDLTGIVRMYPSCIRVNYTNGDLIGEKIVDILYIHKENRISFMFPNKEKVDFSSILDRPDFFEIAIANIIGNVYDMKKKYNNTDKYFFS